MLDVLVFVKQYKLVQCIVWIESTYFSSYYITVRSAIYLCLGPEISATANGPSDYILLTDERTS